MKVTAASAAIAATACPPRVLLGLLPGDLTPSSMAGHDDVTSLLRRSTGNTVTLQSLGNKHGRQKHGSPGPCVG